MVYYMEHLIGDTPSILGKLQMLFLFVLRVSKQRHEYVGLSHHELWHTLELGSFSQIQVMFNTQMGKSLGQRFCRGFEGHKVVRIGR